MTFNSGDGWPFDQAPSCATMTMRQVLEGSEPILFVYHNSDDEGWQFIGFTGANVDDGRVVCLDCIVGIDPTVVEVADLPPGWRAVRECVGGPWTRTRHSESESLNELGELL